MTLLNQTCTALSKKSPSMPCLEVHPQVSLVDEKICIKSGGLRPSQKVTLRARVKEQKAVFTSCGQFVSDSEGCVDTTLHKSHGGTYTGIDVMGLFWSLKPVPGVSKTTRLVKADVSTPLLFEVSVVDGHVEFENLEQTTPTPLAETTCERWYKHRDVRRIVVREGVLRGTVFLPPGSGPFPAVIDLFGTAGGLLEFRAALLASRGFAVFALAYVLYEDLPKSFDQLDVNYFLQAVDWFSTRPYVFPGGLGVVGVSKGGELAFVMGMCCDKIKAIVSISGAPILAFYDLKKDGEVFREALRYDPSKRKITEEGFTGHDCFSPQIEDILPAWEKGAQILYLCGDDDGTWNTPRLTSLFKKRCPSDRRQNIEIVIYPRAGHLIEPPYMPLCRTAYSKFMGTVLVWGGRPEAHAAAQEDAWRRVLEFLNKHLVKKHSLTSHL